MNNRLGIFAVYTPDGIVGEYREYLLNDMMKNLSCLVIVCNGYIQESEMNKLLKYTRQVYVRENQGFDVGALKAALCDYIGWDKVKEYDEIVFFNDSFYGPLYPFERMFDKMGQRDVDFWGILKNKGRQLKDSLKVDEHIQSFFYAVRKRMLSSDEFESYWKSLNTRSLMMHSDAIEAYENKFTQHFACLGFSWDVYVDSSKFEAVQKKSNGNNWGHFDKIIAESECPVVKRKFFTHSSDMINVFSYQTREVLSYIQMHTEYDISRIWKDLLGNNDLATLIKQLSLYYVLPITSNNSQNIVQSKIGALIYIDGPELLQYHIDCIMSIPNFVDVHIAVQNHDIQRFLVEEIKLKQRKNVMIEFSEHYLLSYLEYLRHYDYICCITDICGCNEMHEAYRSRSYDTWGNAMASEGYVWNVIETFNQNPQLGILTIPLNYHSAYLSEFREAKREIADSYSLLKSLGLRVSFDSNNLHSFNLNAFWCRSDALRLLSKFSDKMFSPYAYPLLAQHEGFYTGILMREEYAKVEIAKKTNYLSEIYAQLSKFPSYLDPTDCTAMNSLRLIVEQNRKAFVGRIYLYGAGQRAKRCYENFIELGISVYGFIVSDGHKVSDTYMGLPVFELSKIVRNADNVSVFIAVTNQLYDDIRRTLEMTELNIIN